MGYLRAAGSLFVGVMLVLTAGLPAPVNASPRVQDAACTDVAPAQAGSVRDAADVLAISITTDKNIYDLHEPWGVVIKVHNTSSNVEVVRSPRALYVLLILNATGDAVHFTPIPPGDIYCTFLPGQTMVLTSGVRGHEFPPGDYLAKATIRDGASASVRFTVADLSHYESVALARGCNNVTLTWAQGTEPARVASSIVIPTTTVAIWHFEAAAQRFIGWSPQSAAASDLVVVNRLETVFICVPEANVLVRPPV